MSEEREEREEWEEWAADWIRRNWTGRVDRFWNRFFVILWSSAAVFMIWVVLHLTSYWLVPGPWEMSDEQRLDIRFRREFYQCRKVHGSWNYGYNGDTRVWWCGDAPRPGVF